MISKTDILELKAIIASEYQVNLSVEEVENLGEKLIGLFSAVLGDRSKESRIKGEL